MIQPLRGNEGWHRFPRVRCATLGCYLQPLRGKEGISLFQFLAIRESTDFPTEIPRAMAADIFTTVPTGSVIQLRENPVAIFDGVVAALDQNT